MNPSTAHHDSRWPHRVAVMVVCAAFPLIWVGGLVTSTGAGMAVPDWPNTFGYNLFAYPLSTWVAGPWDLFIEHGHRLFAAAVGLLTIGLAAVLWLREERRWVQWLGVAAVALVIAQGVLGGLRVVLSEVQLAKIHGCVGPLFFAVTVALAVVTSRFWRTSAPQAKTKQFPGSLARHGWFVCGVIYLQIVAGAHVRHVSPLAGPDSFRIAIVFHLILALLVVLSLGSLMISVARHARGQGRLVRPAWLLLALVAGQLVLGGGSWVVKYGWPEFAVQALGLTDSVWAAGWTNTVRDFSSSVIVTAHVATGSLMLVLAVMIALRASRLAGQTKPHTATRAFHVMPLGMA